MAKTTSGKEVITKGNNDIAANGLVGNRVMVSLSKTINLGNYQSIRIENADCRVVEDGESRKAVRDGVFIEVATDLLEMIEAAKEIFDKEK